MVKINKEELKKLARLSSLKLYDSEVDGLAAELKILLEYMEEIRNLKFSNEESPIKNINVLREDEAKEYNSSLLLKNAPKTSDGYFSVPKAGGDSA